MSMVAGLEQLIQGTGQSKNRIIQDEFEISELISRVLAQFDLNAKLRRSSSTACHWIFSGKHLHQLRSFSSLITRDIS